MRLKRVLGLVLALAMVMSVVPAFSITAGAAEVDEGMKVLTDMSTYEMEVDPTFGDKKLPANGWSYTRDGNNGGDMCLNKHWSAEGQKIGDLAQPALQAWNGGGTGSDLFLTANFDNDAENNYSMTLNADKVVIDFAYAADTMDGNNRASSYQYWRFKDADGNDFAHMGWDANGGAAVGFPKAGVNAFSGEAFYVGELNSNNLWRAYDEDKAAFDKLLGVNYRISAEQQEDGTWNVTYLYDLDKNGEYEEIFTDKGKKINGFKSVQMVVGGWGKGYRAMALMNLKVSYHETPAAVNVKYVDADNNVIKTVPIEGLFKGKSYEYTIKDEDASIETESGKTVYLDKDLCTLKIDLLKETGNEIILKYVEDKPVKVEDLAIATRVGLKAKLPETVTAIGAQGTEFHDVDVTWDEHSAPVEKADYQVTGRLTNFPEVTFTANVTVTALEDYLVASYSFEGNGKNDIKDAYTAEILGECSFDNGIDGKGVRFPSNANHDIGTYGIKLGGDFLSDPVIQETKEMTLTMYIKQEGAQLRYSRVFDFGGGDRKDDIYLAYEVEAYLNHLNANGAVVKPRFDMFPSSNGNNDQWSQFVMTMKYDGEKTTIKLYSNGEAMTSRNGGTVLTDPIVMELPYDATTKFAGGNYYLGASNWWDPGFRGRMDEVKIYGAAMEESEIKTLYENMPVAHTETINLMFEGNQIGSVQYPNVEGKSEIAQCYAGNILKLDEATPLYYTADGTVYVREAIAEADNEITLTETENPDLKVNYVKATKLDITNAKNVTAEGTECFKDGDSYYVPHGAKVTIEPADGYAAFVKDNAIIENTFTADGDAVIKAVEAGVGVVGAQVRIAQGVDETGKINKAELESSGLRFVVEVNKTDTVAGYAEKPTYGVEIVPADTPDAKPADIEAGKFQNETIYTAALVNMSVSNYNRRFTAKPYVKIGETKYYGESLDRSIYEVSAGLMKTKGSDEITDAVYDVLNAYVNQVGVRIDIDKTAGTVTADDVYTGDVFFTVTGAKNETGDYYNVTVVLGDGFKTAPTLKDWWTTYVRVNNNNTQAATYIKSPQYIDETKTLTFVFDPKGAYTAPEATE